MNTAPVGILDDNSGTNSVFSQGWVHGLLFTSAIWSIQFFFFLAGLESATHDSGSGDLRGNQQAEYREQ